MEDLYGDIERLAPSMNALQFDSSATLDFSLLSGGLIWSDERPRGNVEDNGMFRFLLHYRSSVIEGKPALGFTEYWEAAKIAFPQWPGFIETRCQPSEYLKEQLVKMRQEAEEALDRAIAEGS